jgi:hypothetical protein
MTELQREQIVGRMFPDWREHLNDGRVIDHILEGLTCDGIVFNRCSRPSCKNVARAGLKTCTRCAAKTALYMRLYKRRKKPQTNTGHQDPGTIASPPNFATEAALDL